METERKFLKVFLLTPNLRTDSLLDSSVRWNDV